MMVMGVVWCVRGAGCGALVVCAGGQQLCGCGGHVTTTCDTDSRTAHVTCGDRRSSTTTSDTDDRTGTRHARHFRALYPCCMCFAAAAAAARHVEACLMLMRLVWPCVCVCGGVQLRLRGLTVQG